MKPQLDELKQLLQNGGRQVQDAQNSADDATNEAASASEVRVLRYLFSYCSLKYEYLLWIWIFSGDDVTMYIYSSSVFKYNFEVLCLSISSFCYFLLSLPLTPQDTDSENQKNAEYKIQLSVHR